MVQLDRDGLADAPPAPWDPTFRPTASGTLSGDLPAAPGGGAPVVPDGSQFDITVNPGGGAADLATVTASIDYRGVTPETYAAFRPFLEAAIRAADRDNALLAGATVQLTGNRFRVLLGRTGPGFEPDAVIRFAEAAGDTTATDLVLTAAAGATEGDQMFVLDNGADGAAPGEGELRGTRAAKAGLYALEDVDQFNILCIARAAELNGPTCGRCTRRRAVLRGASRIPAARRVGDTGFAGCNEDVADDNANLRHRNAAVYFRECAQRIR
jgi:hypothetical protein